MAQYVVAGGSTVSGVIKRMIEFGQLTEETANKFIENTTDLYLTSIGETLSKKSTFSKEKFVKNAIKLYQKTYNQPWFKSAKKVVDSGGYQISINYVKVEDIPDFMDAYFELYDHPDVGKDCAYMLSLDIVGDQPTFESVDQLDKLNRMFLERAKEVDTERMFFVYHFINPKLEKFWWQLIEDYGKYFKHFSIGGLVAFSRGSSFPFSIYALPLLKIINFKQKHDMLDSFNFHILGVSSLTDIVTFIIIEAAIQKVYDIDVKINFDSTRVLRETSVGKRIPVFIDGHLRSLTYRSDSLHLRAYNNMTNADLIKFVYEKLNEKHEFTIDIPANITKEVIYKDNGDGPIKREIECPLILASIDALAESVDAFIERSHKAIDAWFTGHDTYAESIIRDMLIDANYGKQTKGSTFKTRAILNTLELIKQKPDNNLLNQMIAKTLASGQPLKIFDNPDLVDVASVDIF